MENGKAEMPENTVSSTTLNGPSCKPAMAEIIVATASRDRLGLLPMIFLKMKGYTTNAGQKPILKILQPSAKSPPSAKKSACTTRTDAIVRKAA